MATKNRLIRKNGAETLIGDVLNGTGTNVKVQWHALGNIENLRLRKTDVIVALGSLVDRIHTDPKSVLAEFHNNPEHVFYLALGEPGDQPVKILGIKKLLTPLGIEEKELAETWESNITVLSAREDVEFFGSKRPTVGAAFARKADDDRAARTATTQFADGVAAIRHYLEQQEEDRDSDPEYTDKEPSSAQLWIIGQLQSANQRKKPKALDVTEFLDLVSTMSLIPHGLACKLIATLPRVKDILVAATVGSRTKSTWEKIDCLHTWNPGADFGAAIGALLVSDVTIVTGEGAVPRETVLGILEFLNVFDQLDSITPAVLVTLLKSMTKKSDVRTARISEVIIRSLAATVREAPIETLKAVSAEELAGCLKNLPLTQASPRVDFLLALLDKNYEELLNSYWWTSCTWDDLNSLGQTKLFDILKSRELTESVRQPAVRELLTSIGTRAFLGRAVSSHLLIAELITPDDLVQISRSIAKKDGVFSGWLNALGNVQELKSLETANRELIANASQLQQGLKAENTANRELTTRLERIEAQLTEARSASAGLIASERRQLVIDAMRALGQVAATMEALNGMPEASSTLQKASSLLGRQGVECFAAPGDIVSFDPLSHNAPAGKPAVGSRVTVVRGGYKWNEENVVLIEALVSEASN